MRVELPKEKVFPMPFRFWLILIVSIILPFFSGMHPAIFVFWLIGLWGLTARRGTTLCSTDQKMFRTAKGSTTSRGQPPKPNQPKNENCRMHSTKEWEYNGYN